MLHLEHHSFPRRQPFHRFRDPGSYLVPHQPPFRVQPRPQFALEFKEIARTFIQPVQMYFGSLIFRACLPPPQMIQTHVGHDAVQPGVETAFEAEAVQIAVNLQEGFLVNVARVFWTLHQVHGQPQYVAVEPAHQFLESRAIPGLCLDDEGPFVKFRQRGHRGQYGICSAGPACVISQSQRPMGKRHVRFLFEFASLLVRSHTLANKPSLRQNTQRCGVTQFGRTAAPQVSSHTLHLIQRVPATICFRGGKPFPRCPLPTRISTFYCPCRPSPGYLQERLSLSARLQSGKPEVLLAPPHTPCLACDKSRLVAPAVPRNRPAVLESPAPGNSPADLVGLRAQRQRPLPQETLGRRSTALGSPLYFPSLPPSPARP